MTTWIALLRGVNVGGHNTLPMKALRTLLTDLGFANVATYIQSGNCVFDSGASDAAEIAGRISDRIEAEFGFRPNTFVLSLDALEGVVTVANKAGEVLLAEPGEGVNLDGLDVPPGPVTIWPNEKAARALATVTFN